MSAHVSRKLTAAYAAWKWCDFAIERRPRLQIDVIKVNLLICHWLGSIAAYAHPHIHARERRVIFGRFGSAAESHQQHKAVCISSLPIGRRDKIESARQPLLHGHVDLLRWQSIFQKVTQWGRTRPAVPLPGGWLAGWLASQFIALDSNLHGWSFEQAEMIHTLSRTMLLLLLQTDTASAVAARFQLIARRARETYGRVEKLITWRREMQFRSPCGSILLLTFYLVPDKAPPLDKKTKLGRELWGSGQLFATRMYTERETERVCKHWKNVVAKLAPPAASETTDNVMFEEKTEDRKIKIKTPNSLHGVSNF